VKITLVIERMDAWRGGREVSTAQMAEEISCRGHDVTILCESGSYASPTVALAPVGCAGRSRAVRLVSFLARANLWLRRHPCDRVHALLPFPGADVYQLRGGTVPGQLAASLRRRTGLHRRIAALFAPLNVKRRRLHSLERQVTAAQRTLCLPVSRMVAAELAHYYGRREGVQVVYNGVQPPSADASQRAEWRGDVRRSLGIAPDDLMVFTAGKNFALKGVREAITALSAWLHGRGRKARPILVAVGNAHTRRYEQHAAAQGVGDRVRFLPPTPEVSRLYAAADVCVLLSWYDPCSRVILEAIQWGLPTITTTFNGAAEVLVGGAGLVVHSPLDTSAVVRALEELSDAGRRTQCRRHAEAIAGGLSMRRHVEELLNVYAAHSK
jgi:UDP-glucose:(heptosyl)LPS alpha-1,3-glucosyltransferase